mmetsp:Transcript_83816/g.237717  ORF Transcript_83816/g.237717 Transcript_83816/m.237717 type:complete len:203 (+) Transcript_83816:47-655(+)
MAPHTATPGGDFIFRLALIGDAHVGKSSLLLRTTQGAYAEKYTSTDGVDFGACTVQEDGNTIKLQIWDTCGQECIDVSGFLLRGVEGVIVAYDVTSQESFDAAKGMFADIDRHAPVSVHRLLVGNKCDLVTERAVPYSQAREFAYSMGIDCMETSAKSAYNVEEVFLRMARGIRHRLQQPLSRSSSDRSLCRVGSLSHSDLF